MRFKFGAVAAGAGCFVVILNLAFWLALIGGTIWLIKHFFF